MPDVAYWRERAEMCLRVAEQVSQRQDAEKMRAEAAAYIAKAEALENNDAGNTPRAPPARE